MRRVLLDYARQRGARKRSAPPGDVVAFEGAIDTPIGGGIDVIALDQALAELEDLARRTWSSCGTSAVFRSRVRALASVSLAV